MAIIIEILIAIGFLGSIIWAGIKSTAQTVSAGVKEKMQEREQNKYIHNTEAILDPNPHQLFSERQKEAIIISYLALAYSDEEFHPKEEWFINNTAHVLRYYMNYDWLLTNLTAENIDKSLVILREMTQKQKDWYILHFLELMHVDEQVTEGEIAIMKIIFYGSNISLERVEYVIDKVDALIKKHKSR